MHPILAAFLLVSLATAGAGTSAPRGPTPTAASPGPTAAELAGTWAGTLEHAGETQPVALGLEPGEDGRITLSFSLPVVHFAGVILGRVALVTRGDSIALGPFAFAYDATHRTLSGVMPRGLVPVYSMPVRLAKVERFDPPARSELGGAPASPVWSYAAGSPVWAGPTFAGGTVYVGTQDGSVHAIDARTGIRRWTRRLDGAIRTRPVVSGGAVYLQADDGFLYKLAAASGAVRWRARIVEEPIARLPFDDPKSRYDRFGSDVTVAGGRLYVGTHDGKVLAIDPGSGRRVWEFAATDAVLAAPAVADGRVVFGSFDHFVYALAADSGRLLWKRDTQGAVVSTPAIAGDRAVVGNRCYDLLGLNVETGDTVWKDYVWSSWVESSATIRDGTAYVGSSDAAAVFAYDVASGRRLWAADAHGWSWGQPAVGPGRVYAGTSSQVGYPVKHEGGVVALDRATGAVVWRFSTAAPDSGAYGFPGSPALGAGRVFVGGLDGRVHAFAE